MLRYILSATFAALLALAAVGSTSAHADLVSSTPADGARLDEAPAQVTLVFSEELLADGNVITVTDATGAQVDRGDTTLDLNDPKRVTLFVTLRSGLGAGAYTVSWKNASADGHSEEGSFGFTIGAASAPTTPAALPATGPGDELPVAGLLALAAVLLGLGSALRRRPAR